MKKVWLKNKRDAAVKRFHPWVFSGAIAKKEGRIKDGELIELLDHKDHFLAYGHFQNNASISIRLVSFEPEKPDASLWLRKLEKAFNTRQRIGYTKNESSNTYRLIHAEGDGFPGLILDYYNGNIVFQAHSVGMHKTRYDILEGLKAIYKDELQCVYDKSKETLPTDYANSMENGPLFGTATETIILENGNQFYVDWQRGQKTGFFLDQRLNRKLLADYAPGKSVLNAFCYSGGFSIYALKAGAKQVHSVDSSAKAIDWTVKNTRINALNENHEAFCEDVLSFLKKSQEYEVMVLDPPAYAKNLRSRHNAVQGYKRLNAAGMRKLAPGGILFTFSCSQVVDAPLFKNTIVAAGLEAGRSIRILEQLSQAPDHPINLYHPEGSYLKGLVLYVE